MSSQTDFTDGTARLLKRAALAVCLLLGATIPDWAASFAQEVVDVPVPDDHPLATAKPAAMPADAATGGAQGTALTGNRGAARISTAVGDDGGLQVLDTGDAGKGWEAVGRIDLGDSGFCTGALISDTLVLTAAHCLFNKDSGARIPADKIRFLAGWRNGRAAAYRGIRDAVIHPEYVYDGRDRMDRVAFDLALIELDHPVRLPSILPFTVGGELHDGDRVGVVSYARDRSEAPSLQRNCAVLGGQPGVVVLSCLVDFGSSGSPIFRFGPDGAQIVSVVSAKAELEGKPVALGTLLEEPLAVLRAEIEAGTGAMNRPAAGLPNRGAAADAAGGGAKFLRP